MPDGWITELVPHRSDALITYMKGMLAHSFALKMMNSTAADTLADFEDLVDEHRANPKTSTLRQCVPDVGTFFTRLPMRAAFME